MYIIQTNTSLNQGGDPVDFQSMMYKIKSKNWDEFKKDILNSNMDGIISGTMIGNITPQGSKIISVIISDDVHLEIIMESALKKLFNVKFYKVKDSQFENLINKN